MLNDTPAPVPKPSYAKNDNEHYGDVRSAIADGDHITAVMAAYRIQHPELRHLALKLAYWMIGAEVADY